MDTSEHGSGHYVLFQRTKLFPVSKILLHIYKEVLPLTKITIFPVPAHLESLRDVLLPDVVAALLEPRDELEEAQVPLLFFLKRPTIFPKITYDLETYDFS